MVEQTERVCAEHFLDAMQYGSSGLPLPPPNLAGASLLTVSACSPFNPRTRKPSPMKELKASLSESKGGEARHAAKCWAKPNQLLPGTFHCVEVVRSRTQPQASRKGHRTSLHNGSIRPDTTLVLVIPALLPQGPIFHNSRQVHKLQHRFKSHH